jgi:hypothetical protein
VPAASASLAAFQFHGSSVSRSCRLACPATMRSSTSVSQASGSTPFNFADCTSVAMIAQCRPPLSFPAKSAFFLVIVTGLMARSTVLVCVPCQGALLSPVKIRAGKLSLQPEALGAGQEATNGLKHFEKRPLLGASGPCGPQRE